MTTQERLEQMARAVESIDAARERRPNFCTGIAESMVNGELKKLAEESRRYWVNSEEVPIADRRGKTGC